MKISWRTIASGTYTTLGDDGAREFIIGYRASVRPVLQVETIFRGTNQKVFDRGNRLWAVEFSISREHASLAAAMSYLVTHAAALPNLVHLKIETASDIIYAVRAGMTGFSPADESNKSTLIHYAFAAEDYSATAPT